MLARDPYVRFMDFTSCRKLDSNKINPVELFTHI